MKTLIKIFSALVLLNMTLFLNSCKKSGQDMQGYMTMKMTDAPADYKEVNIDLIGVNIHTERHGWIRLTIKPGIYNLLELQNDISVVLAENYPVPIGKVSQIRFILGDRNTIVTTNGIFDLKIPSGMESGLKINVNETIENNERVIITLDFDAEASVIENGSGDFSLKPVIKVKSIVHL